MNITDIDIERLIDRILNSRKYRNAGLNPKTIQDLIHQEAPRQPSEKALLKAVRRKLHNIVAPYLGDPDYPAFLERLSEIDESNLTAPIIKKFCLNVLSEHASTAERIPHMTAFYDRIFQAVGKPEIILDLACGLHPMAFPWMGLPPTTRYHAYDILQPRINFINHFFQKIGLLPLAENRDILVNPPKVAADMGIFFKEAHRFDKRQPGCNKDFWGRLKVKTLAVSLPTHDLSGSHSLLDQHRKLVFDNLPINQDITELLFENEVVFLINKPGRETDG